MIIVSLDNGIEYVTERFPSFKNVTGNAHSVDKSARTAERRGARKKERIGRDRFAYGLQSEAVVFECGRGRIVMCAGGKRTRYDIHLDIAEAPIVRDASEYRRDILPHLGIREVEGKLAPRAAAGNVNKPILMIRKDLRSRVASERRKPYSGEISVRFDLVRDRLHIAEFAVRHPASPAVVPAVVYLDVLYGKILAVTIEHRHIVTQGIGSDPSRVIVPCTESRRILPLGALDSRN